MSDANEACSPDLLALTDSLCRIPSWWRPTDRPGKVPRHNEMALAEQVAAELSKCPWLDVSIVEAAPGRPNVLAFDGNPAKTEILVAGHLDTVPPSDGWTRAEHSVQDGRYHALGAADTKGGIAAALMAARNAGPTRGVGYLLYCDEEYEFVGMKHFVEHHAQVRPEATLSLCGAPAEIMSGCRGLLEVAISLRGHGGHASRPFTGRSATMALHAILGDLATWVAQHDQPYRTVLNVASIHAGSLPAGIRFTGGPPTTEAIPNRIPDAAWALLEFRTGSPKVTSRSVRGVIEQSIATINRDQSLHISLERFDTRQEMPGFSSDLNELARLTRPFSRMHKGRCAHPANTGYIDVALISGRDGTPALCMGPMKGGAHAPDEWVDLASLQSYHDGLVSLLRQQAVP